MAAKLPFLRTGASDTSGKLNVHNAYCAFKSDNHRLWALVSRDVRIVAISVFGYLATPPAVRLLQSWLGW